MRKKENIIIGTLKQYREEFLMYGKFNLKSVKGIIDSINALHDRQTTYETMVQKRDFNQRNSTMSAIKYSFDLQMFLRNAREEHIEAYVMRRHGRLAPGQPLSVCALLPA